MLVTVVETVDAMKLPGATAVAEHPKTTPPVSDGPPRPRGGTWASEADAGAGAGETDDLRTVVVAADSTIPGRLMVCPVRRVHS